MGAIQQIARPEFAWKPHPGKQEIAFHEWGCWELLYGGAMGGGKMQNVEARVCTPKGWRRIGDLKVGDSVSDPSSGGSCKVIGVFPHGRKEMWRVTTDDGATTLAGEEHRWAFRLPGTHRPRTKASIQRNYASRNLWYEPNDCRWDKVTIGTTADMLSAINRGLCPRIPLSQPVMMDVNGRTGKGAVPAYLAGLLLGDGHFAKSAIKITTVDDEIRDWLVGIGFTPSERRLHRDGKPMEWAARGQLRVAIDHWLRNHGLRSARSWNKFVPAYVFTASLQYRVEFIQGLMDSDGYADERGRIFFTSTSERLADGMRELIWSLGGKATKREKQPFFTHKGERKQGRDAYEIGIYVPKTSALFRLSRKKSRCTDSWNGGYENMRKIVSIEPVAQEEAVCISVSNPYGLYLTDDYIVTHNSDLILGKYLSYAQVFGQWAQGIVFRISYPELEELIERGMQIYCPHYAEWKKQSKTFRFHNGAVLKMRYIERLEHWRKYQGHSYPFQAFDEANNFCDPKVFLNMQTRNRSACPNIPKINIYTANPGGKCHNYFVDRFKIDRYPDGNVVFLDRVGRKRMFIKSLVTDNPSLSQTDYLKTLDAIDDPVLREAYRHGNWNIHVGSYFGDLWNDDHVVDVEPNVPWHWPVFRAADWGSARPFCVLWYTVAVDDEPWCGRYWPNGAIIVLHEYYGTKRKFSNEGLRLPPDEVARNGLRLEAQYSLRTKAGPADAAMWQSDGTPSIAELMQREGMDFTKAHKDRITGWQQVRTRLKGRPETGPMLYFSRRCEHTIATFPTLVRDEINIEDVDSDQEDHAGDTVRYICNEYPVATLSLHDIRKQARQKDDWDEVLDDLAGH